MSEAKTKNAKPEGNAVARLPPPSAEQKKIMGDYARGVNISISAVAGAGKSTTLLLCAASTPQKRCLLITYSKRLQLDLQQVAAARGITNVSVYTYHGAASFCYRTSIHNDIKFEQAVRAPPPQVFKCDVIMGDEMQDCTIAYYVFLSYLLRGSPAPQLIVVGDGRQSINQYKGSRSEFLTECASLFDTGREWVARSLSESWRLTPATARFVNNHVVGSPLIVGANVRVSNLKPRYLAADYFSMARRVGEEIQYLVSIYGHENIAIIAPSVRSISHGNPKNPLVALVKEHLAKFPLYVAGSDDEVLDDRVLKGKLLISSWNSMKGREKDCVIVIQFDELYFQFFERQWGSRPDVPNIVYVAATRAIKQLVVVANHKDTLRTVDLARLEQDAVVVCHSKRAPRPYSYVHPREKDQYVGVLDLLRHIDTTTELAMLALIETVGTDYSSVPTAESRDIVPFGGYSENVAAYYGIVIPRIAEFQLTGATTFGERTTTPNIVKEYKDVKAPWDMTKAAYESFPPDFWENASASFTTDCGERTWGEWFSLAVAEQAVYEGKYHMARQIRHYEWINAEFTDQSIGCVVETLRGTEGRFEQVTPSRALPRGTKHIVVRGIADYVEGGDGPIWEFKTVAETTDGHLLQLACYMALMGRTTGKLYAIKSGVITTIRLSSANAATFIQIAMSKYDERPSSDIRTDIERFRAGLKPLTVAPVEDCADDGGQMTEYSLDDM